MFKPKDPVGMAFRDYYNGKKDAVILFYNNFGEPEKEFVGTYFRNPLEFELEKSILGLCQGKVLDIGAGTGCHSFCKKEV